MRSIIARIGVPRLYLYPLLSFCFVFVLMLACNSVPRISQASASDLSFSITVLGQYSFANSEPASMIEIFATVQNDGQYGYLGNNLSLACNGRAFDWFSSSPDGAVALPRQPAGGAYQCLYTDQNGKKTPIIVPIPQEKLQIISPAAGAAVPIPAQDTHMPTSGLLPTATPARSPGQVSALIIHYTPPVLPADAAGGWAKVKAAAGCKPVTPAPVWVRGDSAAATGMYVLTDASIPIGSGFDAFTPDSVPNSGIIEVDTAFSWLLPAGGFHAVRIEYDDTLINKVTWRTAPAA